MRSALILLTFFMVFTAFAQQPPVTVIVDGKPAANPQVNIVNGCYVVTTTQTSPAGSAVTPQRPTPAPVIDSKNGSIKVPVAREGKVLGDSEYVVGNGGSAIQINGSPVQNKQAEANAKQPTTSKPGVKIPDGMKADTSRPGIMVTGKKLSD